MALDGMRILVIEDSTDIRDVFTVLLRAEGADVVAAATGREGAEIAAGQRFDVIMSDLGLPDIPGDVLIRQIRGAATTSPRIIVVTGYGEPYVTRARQAGAEAVLTKPVEWSRVLSILQRRDIAA